MKIHVKIQGKTFTVRIGDIQARPIQAEVDGEIFEVWPEEILVPAETSASAVSAQQLMHPVKPIGTSISSEKPDRKDRTIIAPIPGTIVEISAKEGVSVTYGQELCVLEAMKMKNSIRASRDGIIEKIVVTIGDHVQQSQILMEYGNKEA